MLKWLFYIFAPIHLIFQLGFHYYIGPVMARQFSKEITRVEREEFIKFRYWTGFILYGSAITFVPALIGDMGSLDPVFFTWTVPATYIQVTGALMLSIGLTARYLAYSVIGEKGYYCYNFFCPPSDVKYKPRSIYRVTDNPMYSLGYLMGFGLPLLFLSQWMILVAILDWFIVASFYYMYEHRHTQDVLKPDAEENNNNASNSEKEGEEE